MKLIGILVFCSIIARSLCKDATVFNRNRSLVWLSPYVNYGHFDNVDSMSITGLIRMLEVVASRFSKIVTYPISIRVLDQAEGLILQAAAMYNLQHQDRPIELYIQFEYLENSNEFLLYDNVQALADRANDMYRGSVKSILFYYQESPCRELEAIFDRMHNMLRTSNHTYQTGITLSSYNKADQISKCLVEANFTSSLHKIEQFVIQRLLSDTSVSDAITITTKYYANATTQISKSLKGDDDQRPKEFILLSGYESEDDIHKVVNFWLQLNDWATLSNTTVAFYQAFDQFFRTGHEYYYGWWRLKRNKHYQNVSEYDYEAKEDVIALEDEERQNQQKFLTAVESVTIGASILVVLLFTLASMLCFYKRIMQKATQEILSKQEKMDFLHGATSVNRECHLNLMNHLEYDKRFEVPLTNIIINENQILGSGNFGIVYVANLIAGEKLEPVAAKMARLPCPVQALRGLLSEIKVLSYLGEHENITKLIGAYTADMQTGKVIVLTELCAGGSLEKYLQSIEPESTHVSSLYNKLLQWACEIASGMEFLASKHVIHADLATRNVLLTSEFQAKICDFGLSRRLYNLSNYEKGQNDDIPWRWTAPEALKFLVFNEKTDVWAFGVTMWEIFSLGDLPYLEISGSSELLEFLSSNQKLSPPIFCNNGALYANIMKPCWSLDPTTRPGFSVLHNLIQNLLVT